MTTVETVPSVAVVSDQLLLTETVRTALGARGFEPVVLSWPCESSSSRSPQAAGPGLPDVAVLLNDLEAGDQLDRLRSLVHEVPVPWVVLTDSPRGPLWGAALEAGARSVLPSTSSLDAVVHELRAVLGDSPQRAHERAELLELWHEHVEQTRRTQEQLECLTGREVRVLRLLCAGDTVCTIAEGLDVSESTVRSQVRAIARKLGVGSQVAAVSVMDHALQLSAQQWSPPQTPPPTRHPAWSPRHPWVLRRPVPGI